MLALILACTCQPASPTPLEGEELGRYPLCEPSALLPLDDGSFLLADNEGRPADPKDDEDERPTLWVVPGAGGEPRPVPREEAGQDVESLVRLDDELWVLGSLSRNKKCERKPKRWEIHVHPVAAWTAGGIAVGPAKVLERKRKDIEAIEGSVSECVTRLFRGLAEARPVCEAIVAGAASPRSACTALAVEGAVAVDGRVWVGLRAPLVDDKAVLARVHAGHEALSFDAFRLVDLEGLGIRELVADGERLYGIAGTVLDARQGERSRLFSVPLAGLGSGDLPVTVHDRDLPPSAEGFRLDDDGVTYVLDGSTGDGTRCEHPASVVKREREQLSP